MINELINEYRERLIDLLDPPERDAIREGRAVANDYMDANVVMCEAFEAVYRRELITETGMKDEDYIIVNKAMSAAEKGL